MSQTIWLVRHANRIDFIDPTWAQSAERPHDPPLSSDGEFQSRELAARLKGQGIAHIFTSPFLRAIQTAHPVAEALELPLKIEPGACEWLNPEWFKGTPDWLTLAELRSQYPRLEPHTPFFSPAFPERKEAECWKRTAQAIQHITQSVQKDFLIVGHAFSVFGMARGLTGGTQAINCALCSLIKLVRQENGSWAIELGGDTSHLSQPVEPFWVS